MDDFYLTLPSNVESVYFENTSANFRTKLTKRINIDDKFEVGLAEISYSLRFYNILDDEIIKLKYYKGKEIEFITTKLKAGFYKINELLETINNSFEMIDGFERYPKFEIINGDQIRFQYGLNDAEKFILVELSNNLCGMLGYEKDSMDRNSSIVLVSNSNLNTEEEYFDGVKPYDIKAGIHTLFIYCDIIKPHLVGDTNSQLLKFVEIPNNLSYGNQVHVKYSNIQYFKIQTKEFDSIEIDFKDDSGETIAFSNAKNIIVLHFRKRL